MAIPINPATGKAYATTDVNPATGKMYTSAELTQTFSGPPINPVTQAPYAARDGAINPVTNRPYTTMDINPGTGRVYTQAELAAVTPSRIPTGPTEADKKAAGDNAEFSKKRDAAELAAQEQDRLDATNELSYEDELAVSRRAAEKHAIRLKEMAARQAEMINVSAINVPAVGDSDLEQALKALGAGVDTTIATLVANQHPTLRQKALMVARAPLPNVVVGGVRAFGNSPEAVAAKNAQGAANEAQVKAQADPNNKALADAAKNAQDSADEAAQKARVVTSRPGVRSDVRSDVRSGGRVLPDGTVVFPDDAAYDSSAAFAPVNTIATAPFALADSAHPWAGVSTEDRINYEVDRLAAARRVLTPINF
jgi:hypothetical protein